MNSLRLYMKKELRKKYPSKPSVNDGILVPKIYNKEKTKVMFLLKETFGSYNNIIGPQEIFNGKSSPFWPNIYNWTKIVNSINSEFYSKNKILKSTQYIDNIAYVNIKKVNENKKISDDRDILSYARSDKVILKYQMDKIKPDVIFTSKATLKSYKIIYSNNNVIFQNSLIYNGLKFELYKHKYRWIVRGYHPSAFPIKQYKTFELIKELVSKSDIF